jgi:parallel beta-helix repeat protein
LAGTTTVSPVADSYVYAGKSVNYGTSTLLRVDGSPMTRTLLKFQRPSGTVTSVKLRVYKTAGPASSSLAVRKALSESWSEGGVTYANQPRFSETLASATKPANGWVEIRLPASSLNASGTTTFVLTRPSTTSITLASRESSYDPQLVTTTSTPTPTPTPSPTPTPTPTPTPAPPPSGACPAGSKVMTSGSIASQLAATPAGGTLCLNGGSYSVSSTVAVTKTVKIVGVGSPKITQTFTGDVFSVTAPNVTIQGLTMVGANRRRTGESCSGTGAIAVGAVSGVKILSNTADSFTCGIQLSGTSSFAVSGNRLSRIKYAGITTYPASNGTIDGNTLTDVDHDGPLGENAYGIVVGGDVSRSIVVSNNAVRNAPTWECYDTHDGQSIDFLNNTCVAPGRVGINHVNSGIADPSGRVEGNTIDAGGIHNQWNSIAFGGYGTVKNNIIKGFGSCMFWTPHATVSGNSCS